MVRLRLAFRTKHWAVTYKSSRHTLLHVVIVQRRYAFIDRRDLLPSFLGHGIQLIHLSGDSPLVLLNRRYARVGRNRGPHVRFVEPDFVSHDLALRITTSFYFDD